MSSSTASKAGYVYGYVIGALLFGGTYLANNALAPWLGERSPFLLYVLPLLACGLFFGKGPAAAIGFATLALGAAQFATGGYSPQELVEIVTFLAVCVGVLAMTTRVVSAGSRALGDRTRAQAAAAKADESAQELNLLIEGATDYAIFMTDRDGLVDIWNKGAERVLGWTEEEAVGRSWSLFFPAEAVDAGEPITVLAEALESGSSARNSWLVRRNGSEFLAEASVSALFDKEGTLRGFGIVLRDVTDQQASATAMARREKLLKAILDTVPDALIVIDAKGAIVSFSATAERMFGYSEAELVGRNVNMLMPSPDREQHDDYLNRYVETGEKRIIGIGRVVTGLRRNGEIFPMELSVGEAIGDGQRLFTGFIRDLTEKQQTEARLQELQAELIHVSRLSAMGTMASTLAHELNQPLTAIANYAEALAPIIEEPDRETCEMLRDVFEDLAAQSMRAGRVVRRLREFVARGEVEKRIEDLPALITEATGLALVGISEKGIAFSLELDPAATPVLVDRVQIQQVLINLMRNAIEAMADAPARRLTIRSRANAKTISVSVKDTGPGLRPEVQKHLFQAFVSTKESGMGLGLSICRTIVEAHGGTIQAGPGNDGGTVFEFTLPRVTES